MSRLPLFHRNYRLAAKVTLSLLACYALIAFLYETRFGYELIDPGPLPTPSISPEAREGISPSPCVAYVPPDRFGGTNLNCPAHHAVLANGDMSGPHKSGPGRYVELLAICCPLPSEDILTDDHLYSEQETCPEQYISTGGFGACSDNCTMRCTKINSKRYKLGKETQSYYVKFARAGRSFGQGAAGRVYWERLPASLRFAANRTNHSEWAADGCIGNPPGSVLVAKRGKRCDGFFYREIQYLDGVPVKILPDCPALSDPYSSSPTCVEENDQSAKKIITPFTE